jgi:hypothetical protein
MEKEFWNKKYESGGISGKGSIGFYRNWKWNQIKYQFGTKFSSVIDVGCGDLSFWNHPIAKEILKGQGFKYTGIDISDYIIKRNRKEHPELKFICDSAHYRQPGLRGSLVLALDLLFHIMDDGEYRMAIETLCQYANQFLVIYTWQKNPFFNTVTDGKSQYFRKLGEMKHIFINNDMQLVNAARVPYDQFGKMYFFRRVIY